LNKDLHTEMDILVTKYMLQETTNAENVIVEKWIYESEANKKEMEHLAYLWEQSKKINTANTSDENLAWQKLKTRINTKEKTVPVIKMRNNKLWLRIAAVVLILFTSGFLLKNLFTQKEKNIDLLVKTENTIIVDTLPDQSKITLNKNSSIAYNKNFIEGDKRVVKLTGEAFFDITPNKEKPFIIQVNDVEVKVVGTSFNIKTINGQTEIIVKTGIVEVTRNKKTISLTPNEKIITSTNKELAKTTYNDKLYDYYKSNEFVCDETPLWRLVEVLNEAYNTNIIIGKKELNNMTITTTFANEKIETILQIISTTLQLEVIKKEGKIILQ
jgi:transmembrane sensor